MLACQAFSKDCVCASVCLLEVGDPHPTPTPALQQWFSVSVVLHLYLFVWHVTVTKVPPGVCDWAV